MCTKNVIVLNVIQHYCDSTTPPLQPFPTALLVSQWSLIPPHLLCHHSPPSQTGHACVEWLDWSLFNSISTNLDYCLKRFHPRQLAVSSDTCHSDCGPLGPEAQPPHCQAPWARGIAVVWTLLLQIDSCPLLKEGNCWWESEVNPCIPNTGTLTLLCSNGRLHYWSHPHMYTERTFQCTAFKFNRPSKAAAAKSNQNI